MATVLPIALSDRPIFLLQTAAAGQRFTGAIPADAPSVYTDPASSSRQVVEWSPGTVAGLFPLDSSAPAKVLSILLNLGASLAYTVSIVHLTSAGNVVDSSRPTFQIAAGTAQHVSLTTPIILAPGQAIQVVTPAAGAGAMAAQVCAVIANRQE